MVLLGGLTRLTDSGLSITEWQPLSGILPPLSEAEWGEYFAKYQQIPEYHEINKGISLGEFKEIFWLEYIHRLFGRLVGLLFFVPFVYFVINKMLSLKVIVRLSMIFGLGAVQGAIGWYMVSSGLTERTDVSQYRLALHLIMALLIYSILLWTVMDIKYPARRSDFNFLSIYSKWLTCFIFFMIFLGALMAGTDAGFVYIDGIIPFGAYDLSPWWRNHFENPVMIQTQHKLVAIMLAVDIISFSIIFIIQNDRGRFLGFALIAALALQIALGIATLYHFRGLEEYFAANGYKKMFQFPVMVAVVHQLGALLLLTVNLIISHKLLRKEEE